MLIRLVAAGLILALSMTAAHGAGEPAKPAATASAAPAKTPTAPVAAAVTEARQDITLNPDGSGKIVFEMSLPPGQMGGPGLEMMLGSQLLSRVQHSVWAETWADAAVSQTKDGGASFKATAYFKNIAAVDLGDEEDEDASITWTKAAAGGRLLTVDLPAPAAKAAAKPANPPKLTEEEIARRIDAARKDFRRNRESAAKSHAGNYRMVFTVRLPGEAVDLVGLKKEANGTLQNTIDSAVILQAVEKAMADDAFMRECIVAGRQPLDVVREREMPATLKARVTGEMKPQFDYAAEVKAAKEAYPKMMEKLGLPPAPAKAAAPAEPAKPAKPAAAGGLSLPGMGGDVTDQPGWVGPRRLPDRPAADEAGSPRHPVDKEQEETAARNRFFMTMRIAGEGLETWSDVSSEWTEGGLLHLTSTGYFKDIAKLKAMGPGRLTWTKDAQGGMTLAGTAFTAEGMPSFRGGPPQPARTEAEIVKRVAELQAAFKNSRSTIVENLGPMNMAYAYRLPGTLAEAPASRSRPTARSAGAWWAWTWSRPTRRR